MHLTFHPVTIDDAELLRNWRNSPEVARYMYTDAYISVEQQIKWLENNLASTTNKIWVIALDHQKIGIVSLQNIDFQNSKTNFAFYLGNNEIRGKKIGHFIEYCILEYVFNTLQLNKLCCEVLDSNEGVIRLHKHFGFQQEGYFRNHIRKNNEYLNIVFLGLFATDWNLNSIKYLNHLKEIDITFEPIPKSN